MPNFYLPPRFKLYCRQADDLHVYKTEGQHVVCEVDGRRVLAANIVALYATDGENVILPEWAVVE